MDNKSTIHIAPEALTVMNKDAEEAYPNECCGFFYGHIDGEGKRHVSYAAPVINSKDGDQRRRFEISPLDYMKAENYALEQGLTLLGVYHSHPNHPARPSIHDLKQAVPFFSYIIISVHEDGIRASTSWLLNEDIGEFEEETVTGI